MSALSTTAIPAETGTAFALADDLVRVTAHNASPLSGAGTNTYVLGKTDLIVIDPGPRDALHLANLLHVIGGRKVQAILVTHAHRDHSDGVVALAHATGAPVWANGPARNGRSTTMQDLCARGLLGESGGTDHDFRPDHDMPDGAEIMLDNAPIRAIHTPGHLSHHLCFAWRDLIFTGDHVMAWTSTVVIPPDGDMTQYMQSLDRLSAYCRDHKVSTALPGHGATIPDLPARITALRDHRHARQNGVFAALSSRPKPLDEIARAAYPDTPAALFPFAAQSCLAQLIACADSGQVRQDISDGEFTFART